MPRILVVDDEHDILALLSNALAVDGHNVVTVDHPAKLENLSLADFDLVIIDIMMPDIDGFELCKKLRPIIDCPILFLTAKTEEADALYGFGLGADDYITKPFKIAELRARVAAHLRREKRERRNNLVVGDVRFELLSGEVWVGQSIIPLTKSEHKLCLLLARNRKQVFSKERIYDSVFGLEKESSVSVITEHVRSIRSKFGKHNPIETVWGVGYRWIT
jgi:DNA-binding response OmpR family regulator